jgi:hypothetical protein
MLLLSVQLWLRVRFCVRDRSGIDCSLGRAVVRVDRAGL